LKDFLNTLNSNVTFTSISDILIVPVKISAISFSNNQLTIFAERFYNDDFNLVGDKKVNKSFNAYIFNVNCTKAFNENLLNSVDFSLENKYNKCSFYGLESSFKNKDFSFINKNELQLFKQYYSNKLDGEETSVASNGEDEFYWSTFCNGVIWMNSSTNSIYLGIKYKKPDLKASQIDYYFIKTDQLFFHKTSKKIKSLINKVTNVNNIIFNQNSILKEVDNLDFLK